MVLGYFTAGHHEKINWPQLLGSRSLNGYQDNLREVQVTCVWYWYWQLHPQSVDWSKTIWVLAPCLRLMAWKDSSIKIVQTFCFNYQMSSQWWTLHCFAKMFKNTQLNQNCQISLDTIYKLQLNLLMHFWLNKVNSATSCVVIW